MLNHESDGRILLHTVSTPSQVDDTAPVPAIALRYKDIT